jgi:gas vesicle protein
MTQYPQQYDAGVGEQEEPLPTVVTDVYEEPVGASSGGGGKADAAKEQAGNVAGTAQEAGQHVAGVAKDQAAQVAQETKAQAKDLISQGREEVRQQASQQQERLASSLHSLSRELHSMSERSEEQGMASDLAREAAQRADSVAGWLDARRGGELLEDVKSFARKRPAAFLGLAAAAGILVGRLGRGLKEGAPEGSQHRVTTSGGTLAGGAAYPTEGYGETGGYETGAYETGSSYGETGSFSNGYTGEHLEGASGSPRYSS